MNFEQWLKAEGYDVEALNKPENAKQKAHLEIAWKDATQKKPEPSAYDKDVAEFRAETSRVERIREVTSGAMRSAVGNRHKIDRFEALCTEAIAGKWDVPKFELAMLREERSVGPMILTPSAPQVSDDVVEAAICVTHGLPKPEDHFAEQTLEVAHRQFRRGLTLKRLMMMGARANGFRGDESDWYGTCRASLKAQDQHGYDMRADVGPSTGIQVPGILSNIANKFLATSFMNVDQSIRRIAKIRPVNDFKQITTYRMAGNNTFLRVPPGGEIKHGALSETSYTNQAKTYGRLLGVSREDYINDDLGAFISVSQELGRGGADGLNNIAWAAFLDDASFFNTDKSKNNYDDGATDSVLSLAGLDNAETIFALQTKPDGTPLGATPKILLVPSALKNTGLTLMVSMMTNLATSTTSLTGQQNVFAGRYDVVPSPFLSRTTLPDENGVSQTVTGSATAWYLLCDPNDIPVIEICFLFGKDTPTVESDQFDFDRLGFATRAYFDFGVSKQEYRGGVKLKGAA